MPVHKPQVKYDISNDVN